MTLDLLWKIHPCYVTKEYTRQVPKISLLGGERDAVFGMEMPKRSVLEWSRF